MQTDLERNSCMLCGEIWNSTNLIKTEFKGHQLRMCPDCASDFDSYVKDKIIAELEKIKGEIQELAYYDNNYCGFVLSEWKVSDIIYDNIRELKGDSDENNTYK